MLHVLFLTIYVMLTPPDSGGASLVQVREWPRPFPTFEACEAIGEAIKLTEIEKLEKMRPDWDVEVEISCRPPKQFPEEVR